MHLHVEGVFTICLMLTLFCAGWFFSFFKEKESKVKLFGSSLSVKLVVFTCHSVQTASVFSFLPHPPHVFAPLQSEEDESLRFESPMKSLRTNIL